MAGNEGIMELIEAVRGMERLMDRFWTSLQEVSSDIEETGFEVFSESEECVSASIYVNDEISIGAEVQLGLAGDTFTIDSIEYCEG